MTEIFTLIILGTSAWAYVDARELKRRFDLPRGPGGNSPGLWLVACLLFWIVFFPFYVVARGRAGDPPASDVPSSSWSQGRYAAVPDHSLFWKVAIYFVVGLAALAGMVAIAWYLS